MARTKRPVLGAFAFMLLGLGWILIYYVSSGRYPFGDLLGNWNILVGFAISMIGFAMTFSKGPKTVSDSETAYTYKAVYKETEETEEAPDFDMD